MTEMIRWACKRKGPNLLTVYDFEAILLHYHVIPLAGDFQQAPHYVGNIHLHAIVYFYLCP